MNDSLEDRVRAVEDKLAIFHLIASHPPAADTGTDRYYREAFVADGEMDLGGGKGARGNDTIGALVKTPEHQAAIAGGLCHFSGLPRVEIDGDSAVAISYLQIITPDRQAAPREVSGHGSTTGFRIHRVGANRWELKRGKDGWKVVRRTLRPLDGTDEARALLRKAIAS
ncbi:MAG TPA: nuclear transport factor 2 family protein [Pseudolabrys sp.]